MPKIILLDLDGVLANLVDASITAHNAPTLHDECDTYNYWRKWPSNEHPGEKMKDAEFWKYCSGYGFWTGIKPYDWAFDLYKGLNKVADVKICTRPRHDDPDCVQGKIDWCKTHLNVPAEDVITIYDKWLLSSENHLLIDDSDENVDLFNGGYGGLAVRFPQPWNNSYLYGWTSLIDVAQRFDFEDPSLRPVDAKLQEMAKRVDKDQLHAKLGGRSGA